jgi:hypothetical protein
MKGIILLIVGLALICVAIHYSNGGEVTEAQIRMHP